MLYKHGALKNQTLRYTVMPTLNNESQALCNEARAKHVYSGGARGGHSPRIFFGILVFLRLFPMQFHVKAELAS